MRSIFVDQNLHQSHNLNREDVSNWRVVMDIRLFNRVGRGRKGRLNQPKIEGPKESIDSFGLLDAGFEDVNDRVYDYAVAPGLMGHFGLPEESTFRGCGTRFERIGE